MLPAVSILMRSSVILKMSIKFIVQRPFQKSQLMVEKPGSMSEIIRGMLMIMQCGLIRTIQSISILAVTVVSTKHLTKAKITFSNRTCPYHNFTGFVSIMLCRFIMFTEEPRTIIQWEVLRVISTETVLLMPTGKLLLVAMVSGLQ